MPAAYIRTRHFTDAARNPAAEPPDHRSSRDVRGFHCSGVTDNRRCTRHGASASSASGGNATRARLPPLPVSRGRQRARRLASPLPTRWPAGPSRNRRRAGNVVVVLPAPTRHTTTPGHAGLGAPQSDGQPCVAAGSGPRGRSIQAAASSDCGCSSRQPPPPRSFASHPATMSGSVMRAGLSISGVDTMVFPISSHALPAAGWRTRRGINPFDDASSTFKLFLSTSEKV